MSTEQRNPTVHERTFFGIIAAGICHEVNNVLAIVSELSGLQGDLLGAIGQGRPLDSEELAGINQRIAGQVVRGKELIQMLHHFAHSMDREEDDLDLTENVHQVLALCQRFARLRRSSLVARPVSAVPNLPGCAFDLQHLLFRCVDVGLAGARAGDEVAAELAADGDRACLRIYGGSDAEVSQEVARKVAIAREVASRLGAEVALEASAVPGDGGSILTLHLPDTIQCSYEHEERQQQAESP